MELNTGQLGADFVQWTAGGEGSEIDGHKSDAVDQFHHQLFGFVVVAGGKDDGRRFVRREVLDPDHRHVAHRFDQSRSGRQISDHLTGSAPLRFQRGS